jgi:hypothetical protein
MTNLPSVRVDDILIHPRDRDLIIATHGRSLWIADDISPLEHLNNTTKQEITLFDPRPAILWKNDVQSQRHAANREFLGKNPQGGTAIHIMAKSDSGPAKVEFLQANKVVSTMDINVLAGMNRFQWNMRGPAPPPGAAGRNGGGGGGGGGRGGPPPEMVPDDPNAPPTLPGARNAGPVEVPFVAATGRGGGGGGGFGLGPQLGTLLEPGSYMMKVTVGGQTLLSSVNVLEDVWLRPQ